MDLNAFCKPCLYGEVYLSNSKDQEKSNAIPSTLLNLAARKIATDSHSTARAIQVYILLWICVSYIRSEFYDSSDCRRDLLEI